LPACPVEQGLCTGTVAVNYFHDTIRAPLVEGRHDSLTLRLALAIAQRFGAFKILAERTAPAKADRRFGKVLFSIEMMVQVTERGLWGVHPVFNTPDVLHHGIGYPVRAFRDGSAMGSVPRRCRQLTGVTAQSWQAAQKDDQLGRHYHLQLATAEFKP
jgi:hypothetical protein